MRGFVSRRRAKPLVSARFCRARGERTEIQDDVFLFAVFMTALAPAPRDFSDQISINRGQPIFTQVGCAGCHVATTFRTPANPPRIDIGNGEEFIRVPGNFAINPFGDFLKHDMGALGDRIGEAPPDDPAQGLGDTLATTRQMRTAPLWVFASATACCTTAAAATSLRDPGSRRTGRGGA